MHQTTHEQVGGGWPHSWGPGTLGLVDPTPLSLLVDVHGWSLVGGQDGGGSGAGRSQPGRQGRACLTKDGEGGPAPAPALQTHLQGHQLQAPQTGQPAGRGNPSQARGSFLSPHPWTPRLDC